MNWTMITAISTAVSVVAFAISAFLIFLQLRRFRFSQEVTVALALYDRSTSPEMLAAASWVKTMPASFSYENYLHTPEARQKIENLWYYFEFLGVLLNRGYVSEDLIFDQQGTFIAGMWDKTQGLIKARRLDRQSPEYMENFEILRDRYSKWAKLYPPKLKSHEMRRDEAYYEGER